MADAGSLVVRIKADYADLVRGVEAAQKKVASMGPRLQGIGTSMQRTGAKMSLAVTAPILAFGKMGVSELQSIQAANAQTDASVRRLGAGAKVSSKGIQAQAAALQKLSGIDDQAVQSGMNLLLTQGNLDVKTKAGAKAFEKASKVMVDYAAATGKDPVAASRALAKALADPEHMLTRVAKEAGLTQQQQDALKKRMAAVNSPAAKQAILLDALGKKYQGAGQAAGQTLGAKLAVLQDRVAGVAAKFVEALIPAIERLSGWAGKLLTWVEGLSPSMRKWGAIALVVAAALGPVLIYVGMLAGAIGTLMPVIAAISAPILIWVAAIAAVGVALVLLWRKNEAFREGVKKAWSAIQAGVASVLVSLRSTIQTWIGWAQAIWSSYGTQITAVATTVWGFVQEYIGGVLKVIQGVIQTALALISGDWGGAWEGIKTIVSGAFQAIKALVGLQLAAIAAVLTAAWNGIKRVAATAWGNLKDNALAMVTAIGTGLAGAASAIPGLLKSAMRSVITKAAEVGGDIKDAVTSRVTAIGSGLAGAARNLPGDLWDALQGMITKAAAVGTAIGNAIKGAINAVIDKIRTFELPSVEVAGKTIGGGTPFSGLPRLARGGITKGPSLAGEAGPEAVIPLGGSAQNRLDRARVMGELGGLGGGITQHFHVTNPVEDMAAFMRRARFEARAAGVRK